jgi:hypothetical protein
MHNKGHFLLLWISANVLALPGGWIASQIIKPPFGEWAHGGIVIALLALAFRYRGNQVAGWVIWWNTGSLILGFELLLRTSINNPFQAIALSTAIIFILVIPLLVISSPFGIIWLLKVFVEPHPDEPPRRQVLVSYIKSTAKVIMVWFGVCAAGAVLGVAIGMGSRAVGEIYGWTTTMGFDIGARAALGVVSGTITGLALIRVSRHLNASAKINQNSA